VTARSDRQQLHPAACVSRSAHLSWVPANNLQPPEPPPTGNPIYRLFNTDSALHQCLAVSSLLYGLLLRDSWVMGQLLCSVAVLQSCIAAVCSIWLVYSSHRSPAHLLPPMWDWTSLGIHTFSASAGVQGLVLSICQLAALRRMPSNNFIFLDCSQIASHIWCGCHSTEATAAHNRDPAPFGCTQCVN